MDQDHPEERFADPEEVRAEREMHLLLLEAAMYAQMARTNALVAAAAQIDAAVESLLDDLGGERTEDLRRREAELARR
ncbi:hypothetical protein [Deinococcus sp. S9]|uniref:hypothetical protein n=1 Tax=Deinococcus sp. S9 TaxID=2545754 RepID=UPI0010554F79|nr:hypothetical protein [Deinococcus sp. S9]TDE87399.1 hypothetical protein E0686_02590 [Deinococcus sp. S9]